MSSLSLSPLVHQLVTEGYVIFKKCIPLETVVAAGQGIRQQQILYQPMEEFIRHHMITPVNRFMDWDIQVTKYRISNNNNLDASSFHRDVINYHLMETSQLLPIYTCLTYFDTTTMELIPGSHLYSAVSFGQAMEQLGRRKTLIIEPGDILLFHATLLHRGMFDANATKSRRLIQLFDVYPTLAVKDLYDSALFHIPAASNDDGGFLRRLCRVPMIKEMINFISYLNVAMGHGTKFNLDPLKAPLWGNIFTTPESRLEDDSQPLKYASSEGWQARLAVDHSPHVWQPSNKYILWQKTNDLNPHQRLYYVFSQYQLPFFIYGGISLSLLGCILFLLFRRR
jgi:hypothetical protein